MAKLADTPRVMRDVGMSGTLQLALRPRAQRASAMCQRPAVVAIES
jgi:hypothetical protein